MSIITDSDIYTRIRGIRGITDGQKDVLIGLYKLIQKEGPYLTAVQIAAFTHFSREHVQKMITKSKKDGYIQVTHLAQKNPVSVYRFTDLLLQK